MKKLTESILSNLNESTKYYIDTFYEGRKYFDDLDEAKEWQVKNIFKNTRDEYLEFPEEHDGMVLEDYEWKENSEHHEIQFIIYYDDGSRFSPYNNFDEYFIHEVNNENSDNEEDV